MPSSLGVEFDTQWQKFRNIKLHSHIQWYHDRTSAQRVKCMVGHHSRIEFNYQVSTVWEWFKLSWTVCLSCNVQIQIPNVYNCSTTFSPPGVMCILLNDYQLLTGQFGCQVKKNVFLFPDWLVMLRYFSGHSHDQMYVDMYDLVPPTTGASVCACAWSSSASIGQKHYVLPHSLADQHAPISRPGLTQLFPKHITVLSFTKKKKGGVHSQTYI